MFVQQTYYDAHHIWNFDKTRIQASRQLGAKVFVKGSSQQVYNIILKFKEWLTINYTTNATRVSLPGF
jgi:hypothetical protein